MSNGSKFESINTPKLSSEERAALSEKITSDQYDKFLSQVYKAYKDGKDIFIVDNDFQQSAGLNTWFVANIPRLLVDDGHLVQMKITGLSSVNVEFKYLQLTSQGIHYCEKKGLS